jgi:fumarate reductase flavoprotein subunit
MKPGNNSDTLETEVAIIGGGGAGLAAAVAATEMGAKVIVLEKRRSCGGNSALAGGIFAAESPTQRRLRIDVNRDECFKVAMDYAHKTINPRLFRAFVDKSGDTVRWLEDKGLKIYDVPPYYPGQPLRTWHCPKAGGREIVNVLIKTCKALGVPLVTQARATKLWLNDKGMVNGVLVKRKRKLLRVIAKSVIIASGGYAGNKQLIKKYYPLDTENIQLIGLPHMGEGLLMAIEIGADTEGLGTLHLTGPGNTISRAITGLITEPNTIWVNKKGERFIGEEAGFKSFEAVNAQIRQPDKLSFTLFASEIKQYLTENGLSKGISSPYRAQKTRLAWVKELPLLAEKGIVKISDSWDEIANWIGCDAKTLRATIDEYNTACDQGYDPIFAKSRSYLKPLRIPPYYAIRSYPGFLATIGGLKINERMEVIDKHDNPIPGLYAGGNDTGGWEPDTYNINLSGSTCGFAINSGRIAGENAAKYVSGASK